MIALAASKLADSLPRLVRALASDRWSTRLLMVAALVVGATLAFTGVAQGIDENLQGLRSIIRSHPASGKIVLVEIDAKSLRAIDHWPWPRRIHAQAIEALNRAGADTIAFDVDFSAHSNPIDDAVLAKAIDGSRAPVILSTFRQPTSEGGQGFVENLPLPELRRNAELAAVNIRADPDGLVRSYPHGIVTGGIPRPSIGALLADNSGTAGDSVPIDGAIDPASVPRISMVDLIVGKIAPGSLRGRSVLIGATAIELGDRYSVPVHGVLPGPLIQLLAAESFLQGSSPVDRGPLPLLLLTMLILPFILRRAQTARLFDVGLASLGLLVIPLGLEALKLGTVSVVPAEGALLFVGVASAILSSLRSAQEARLIDVETALPNRRALEQAIATTPAAGALVAVRIGGYGKVAGVLGQIRASELILRLAERLALASSGPVYRIEESALAWGASAGSAQQQQDHVDAVAALLRQPIEIGGRQVELSFAFGLVEAAPTLHADDVPHALLAADHALSRGERWNVYSAEINRENDWRLSLAGDLDRAMAAGDVWVAYQPKFDIASGRVNGAEALVRWNHPERGAIPPDAFIPALEESGRILDLTLFVLRQALRDALGWHSPGRPFNVAVNVSALLPSDPLFIAGLKRALADLGTPTGMLTLEVTESATIANPDAAIAAMEKLTAMGLRLSIDDYGTGQSTLSYLKRLPTSEIKIDKSFITALETNRSDQLMVRSTIELAHALDYKVVAEGVENEQILMLLREFGCDTAQGWHVGRPVAAAEFGRWVEDEVVPVAAAG